MNHDSSIRGPETVVARTSSLQTQASWKHALQDLSVGTRLMSDLLIDCTGIILAGGKSTRMGRDKALLPLGDSTVIEHVIHRVQSICAEVLLVAKPARQYPRHNARLVFDQFPEECALVGLVSGLKQAAHHLSFVCACDMPLIAPEVVTFLLQKIEHHEAAVPFATDRWHPLCAIYSKDCLAQLEARITQKDFRLSEAIQDLRLRTISEAELRIVDPELASLWNLNTEEDYQALVARTPNTTTLNRPPPGDVILEESSEVLGAVSKLNLILGLKKIPPE